MITAKLAGKLGNQLFQIANCYAYSKKTNQDYAIEIPKDPNKSVYGKWYEFKNVNYCNEGVAFSRWKEPFYHYFEIPELKNSRLEGGFQSYKYFEEFKRDVINLFSEITSDYKINKGMVSVHVRRGDYLNFPNHHPIAGLDYAYQAIDYFKLLGYDKFMIFSDDIQWCMDNFKNINCKFVTGNDDVTDMRLMSQCEHNIIANSTFSWWAAYLNQNQDKVVIYPSKWFGKAYEHFNTKDLCPPDWIKI